MVVRAAVEADIEGIIAIENREIEEGFSHFGTVPVTLELATAAFRDSQGRFPWFVAVGEAVLGFARCSPWKAREAYMPTCEIGVYVRPDYQGQGIGKALYHELFPALEEAGFHTILAGIALPNPASVKLHEAFGMSHVGTLPEVGFKHGRWISVGYWAKCSTDR